MGSNMYGDFDLDPKNEVDELFDKLDDLLKIAEVSIRLAKENGAIHPKYDTSLDLIDLMMDEVPENCIRVYQQTGGNWIAEVSYRGILFIHASAGKPQSWKDREEIKEALKNI